MENLRGFGFHLQISGWKLFLNWFDLRNEDLASKVMENTKLRYFDCFLDLYIARMKCAGVSSSL